MKQTLDSLCQHNTITRSQARQIIIEIAEGQHNAALVSSFLTVFRMRSVTVDELEGFRQAMLELAVPANLTDEPCVDVCGTGGDGKHTVNISTLAAFVVAGAGVKVVKHGNVGVSSGCGSSDVLASLGAVFTNDTDTLRTTLDNANICYLHAPLFHPAMKFAASVRRDLGVRTFFNLLGPLVNPANPPSQLIGVFSLEIQRLFHYLLQRTSQRYVLVHSLDGYDEVSLTGSWRLLGSGLNRHMYPRELGFGHIDPSAICGGSKAVDNAEKFVAVLENTAPSAHADVVIANAAHAIFAAERECPLGDAVLRARESLESGRAGVCFGRFIEGSVGG